MRVSGDDLSTLRGPDSAPSVYFLFRYLKKHLRERRFQSDHVPTGHAKHFPHYVLGGSVSRVHVHLYQFLATGNS